MSRQEERLIIEMALDLLGEDTRPNMQVYATKARAISNRFKDERRWPKRKA